MTVSRPTILQIIPELETGGAELSTIEIAEAIVNGGGRALVLSEGGRLAPRVAAVGAEFVPFAAATKNPLHVLWNGRTIARMIIEESVDLIHARSRAPAWSALMAARRTGRPFVTTYHGAYSEKNSVKKFYNSVMASGDRVIANSHYTADLIHGRYGTPLESMRVIHRGVDGRRYDPDRIEPQRTAALCKAWGITADEPIILQAARLTAWKGQSVIIEATRLLKNSGRLGRAVVVLAGDDQGRSGYRERLLAEIKAAGLEDRVRLVGHVEDIPAAFKVAHIGVVASIEPEAFGRAAIESQAMGCPVIATNIGAPPETVRSCPMVSVDARTGWLVPPSDAQALADAIEEGLSFSAETRRSVGERARRHVLANYTLERMRGATLAVYDELLASSLAIGHAERPAAV